MCLRAPACLAVLIALVAGLPTSAEAQTAEWDQGRVTAIARELEDATQELRRAMRRQPPPSLGSTQAHSWHRLGDQLRFIARESRELAEQLEQGRGHDYTLPIYQRLRISIRNAQENARRVFIPEGVRAKATVANAALTKLEPFYAPSPDDPSAEG